MTDAYRLFRKDTPGCAAFCRREQLEYMELHLEMDQEPTESLCVKINRQTNTDAIVTGICYRLSDQDQKVDEVFFKQVEEVSHSQALVLIGNSNYFNNLQQNTSNLGGFWSVLMTASWHRLLRSQKGMVFY